ncbi:50S ribosomal protein L18 [Ohtaekwangia koreensis]|uniref:Large ribosomal subunit protein uL18 n=1 Tax=Ohtaekwangia koreensis TaxID=688867 RepID=A0A1T5MJK6_9BACT|nr:50S ribosomal protein L18 [Ohtaekwangia koreensis]SKC88396.1 large subunit ribosomal protein L18 [Ohtaekwangia koreensis]
MAGKNRERRERIKAGVRKRITGTTERPRLSVFRSNRGLYVQIIDDLKGVTVAAASTTELGETSKLNLENSKNVGKKIAEKAIASGVQSIVFDRNGYLYHGNIKALAEGAREGGLKF